MDDSHSPAGYFVFAALLSGFVAGMFVVKMGERPQSSDDWRRTSQGWERISGWSHAAGRAATSDFADAPRPMAQRSIRSRTSADAHPAALALVQLVGSMLALAAFSPRGQSLLRGTSFSAILARSFRASVFGS